MRNNRIFFGLFLLFVLSWVIFLFKSFLLTIIIGVLMAVSTANISAKISSFVKNGLATSILSTLLISILFFAPFIYAFIALAKHAANFDTGMISNTINFIKNYDFNLPSSIAFLEPKIKTLISEIDINSLVKQILGFLTTFGKSSAKFVVDMGLIVVFYFFANLYGNELVQYLKNAVPMKASETEFILSEVANTMSVVFYSTIFNTILQGFLFSLVMMYFGYDGLLFGIVFALSSLIPAVGGALIYVPVSLYELSNGNPSGAIFIFLYSVIVISTIADNIIKPLAINIINKKLLKSQAKINEILIFFSMIAGISTFGFWGLILGPAIITLFLATIKLYTLLKERDIV